MLSRLRTLEDAALVKEYHWWRERYPGITAGMIRAAKAREGDTLRAILAYLRMSDPERRAA